MALADGLVLRTPRWGIPSFLLALAGFLILSVVAVVVAEVLDLSLAWTVLLGTTLPWLGLGGWPLMATWLRGNGPRIDLGLRLTWTDVGWGLLGGLAALLLGGLVATGIQALFPDLTSAAAEVGEELRGTGPYPAVVLFALCVSIGAPIVEEIAFRGLGYNAIAKKGVASGWVIVITTVAFAAFHLEPLRMPILLVSGAIFGLLRWRTRALGASIVAHAVNNLPGAAFLLLG